MKTVNHRNIRSNQATLAGTFCAAVLLLCGAAQGQTIYRIVGADGSITFSDKMPAVTDNATALGSGGRPLPVGNAALPNELRQAIGKYPVTLYTSVNCGPCGQGRELLNARGVPFTEKTVTTPEDAAALQRISGDNSLPLLTIGAQQIKGFSDMEWTQFLDVADYPKTSVLPAGYRNPPPSSLVSVQKATPATSSDASQNQTPVTPANPGPSNPAGIRF